MSPAILADQVSRLFARCTVDRSQLASTVIASFVTFPDATVLLLICAFPDFPMKIALLGLMP
jgi:hypothetical protein